MNSFNKTFLPTKNYKNRNWFLIDCKGQKLGRLATMIAALLKGKIKPHYINSVDIGRFYNFDKCRFNYHKPKIVNIILLITQDDLVIIKNKRSI